MLDITPEAREKLSVFMKERNESAPLRIYLAYG